MADFPIIYTGTRPTMATPDTSSFGRSVESVIDTLLSTQRYAQDKKEAKKKDFLNRLEIDPEQLMSEKMIDDQELAISKFYDKWSNVAASKKGNLDTKDWIEMQKDQNRIDAWQQKRLSDQKRVIGDYETIRKDTTKNIYNKEHFNNVFDKFIETGEYPIDGGLKYNPINLFNYFSKANYVSPTGMQETTDRDIVDGEEVYSKTSKMGTIDEAKKYVEIELLQDKSGRMLESAITHWSSLGNDEKMKYLNDNNNDGVIDDTERTNAIMEWSKDNFAPILLGTKKSIVEKRMPSSGGKKGGVVSSSVNKNEEYDINENVTVGGITFNKFLNLGQKNKVFRQNSIEEVYDLSDVDKSGNPKKIDVNKLVGFYISGYSPDKDWIIISPSKDVVKMSEEDVFKKMQAGDKSVTAEDMLGNKLLKKDGEYAIPREKYDDIMRKTFGIYAPSLIQKTKKTSTNDPLGILNR